MVQCGSVSLKTKSILPVTPALDISLEWRAQKKCHVPDIECRPPRSHEIAIYGFKNMSNLWCHSACLYSYLFDRKEQWYFRILVHFWRQTKTSHDSHPGKSLRLKPISLGSQVSALKSLVKAVLHCRLYCCILNVGLFIFVESFGDGLLWQY